MRPALTLTLSRRERGPDTLGPLPMITSCSPGWISFLEKFYPELIPHASTCRSPMSMLSVLAKTYYAEKTGIDPKKIFMVAVMPCVAKKYEASRPEHYIGRRNALHRRRADHAGTDLDDQVLRDRLHGAAAGRVRRPAGLGQRRRRHLRHHRRRDGGHAAGRQRTGHRQAGRPAGVHRGPRGRGAPRNLRGHRRAQHPRRRGQRIDQRQDSVGQSEGRQGAVPRDRGDGLPRRLLRRRRPALSARGRQGARSRACSGSAPAPCTPIDSKKKLRKSYENPAIEEVYSSFLGGPGTEKAHKLLHTHYHARTPRGIR